MITIAKGSIVRNTFSFECLKAYPFLVFKTKNNFSGNEKVFVLPNLELMDGYNTVQFEEVEQENEDLENGKINFDLLGTYDLDIYGSDSASLVYSNHLRRDELLITSDYNDLIKTN